MKRNFLLLVVALSVSVVAQEAKPYFTIAEMPDARVYLPAPPQRGTARFVNDSLQYEWGKTVRPTERGKQAKADAEYSINRMAVIFSDAFGVEISPKNTPQLWKLLTDATKTADLACNSAKIGYMRPRPYMVFGEPTLVPEDEEVLRKNGSYPSGHTTLGWTTALLLTEINPAAENELLKIGYEYGQSRVIAGFHWQSDVDAARVVSGAAFSRLHTSKAFLKQLHKAQKEFRKKSK